MREKAAVHHLLLPLSLPESPPARSSRRTRHSWHARRCPLSPDALYARTPPEYVTATSFAAHGAPESRRAAAQNRERAIVLRYAVRRVSTILRLRQEGMPLRARASRAARLAPDSGFHNKRFVSRRYSRE